VTRTPLSRSKGQKSTCRGRGCIVAASRTACYYYCVGSTLLCPRPGGIKRWCCPTSVWRLSVAYIRSAGPRPAARHAQPTWAWLWAVNHQPGCSLWLGGGILWRPRPDSFLIYYLIYKLRRIWQYSTVRHVPRAQRIDAGGAVHGTAKNNGATARCKESGWSRFGLIVIWSRCSIPWSAP